MTLAAGTHGMRSPSMAGTHRVGATHPMHHMAAHHTAAHGMHHMADHHMAGMAAGPPLTAHTFLADWQLTAFPIGVIVVSAAIAAWYLLAVRRLSSRGRRWPVSRTVAFVGGLAFTVVALASSVATLTMYTFTAHVLQHLLLMVVAPPLLALGAPMTLLLQTTSRRSKRLLLKGLHSRVFAVIRHPVPVFFFYYLSMYAFFLTPVIGYAMAHMPVMDLINLFFLGGATLFWWPMVGLDPIPGPGMSPGFKVLNLLLGIPVESFLGLALMLSAAPAAAIYTLQSTHTGGGVLWAASELATIGALVPIYVQWTRADARNARRIDARLAAGQPLETPKLEGGGMAATLRSLRRG